jgi:hypothetical protein
MTRWARIALVLAAIGCGAPARRPVQPRTASEPTPPVPATEGDHCERFLRHVAAITGFPESGAGDRAYCEALTPEQRDCGLAAENDEELSLCLQFKDVQRRNTARALLPSIRASWPGSVPLRQLLGGAVGCAFGGIVGPDGAPVESNAVVVGFALREPGSTGEQGIVLAWLTRGGETEPWVCSRTDPPDRCESLSACRP